VVKYKNMLAFKCRDCGREHTVSAPDKDGYWLSEVFMDLRCKSCDSTKKFLYRNSLNMWAFNQDENINENIN